MSKQLTLGNDALQTNQNLLDSIENKVSTYYCCITNKIFQLYCVGTHGSCVRNINHLKINLYV